MDLLVGVGFLLGVLRVWGFICGQLWVVAGGLQVLYLMFLGFMVVFLFVFYLAVALAGVGVLLGVCFGFGVFLLGSAPNVLVFCLG